MLLAVLLAGCAGPPGPPGASVQDPATGSAPGSDAFPVTIDNCGVEVTVTQAPTSIVTLNQGATEQALGLGLANRMAGTAYLDDEVAARFAADYARVPVLSPEYPSLEQFLAAGPDLALTSYESSFTDEVVGTREELASRGIATYVDPLDCPRTPGAAEPGFEDVWSALREIGRLTGASAAAEELVAAQEAQLGAVDVAAAPGTTVLWYDSGEDTPFVGVADSGPAIILDALGADNVFGHLDGGWADGSWETVLEADPDVIVLPDALWSTAEDKIDYLEQDPVLRELTAVREERYVVVPFSETTPGVRLVDGAVHVAEQLADLDLADVGRGVGSR
ncbi:ABC transporter substrate-binding protein [Ornithinimicrobium tianjinense]|uniref:ABC transporter substrate-binding protein n=1 Tax=Ornithinimicrobium tianjinense TaxID=1195761 RepID=A0A917BPQ0_9MICO|nr:ABC transporter substrate-binding protein [Ornithinimicrobium tianjinense]